MFVSADFNEAYGDPVVTAKYSPLSGISFNGDGAAGYGSELLQLRMNVLTGRNLFGTLRLVVPRWDTVRTQEATAGRRPPLVVVSSGRANWIRAGVQAAAARAKEIQGGYQGMGDMRALGLTRGDAARQPPKPSPIYSPTRAGPDRGVYVVVHAAEYGFYHSKLADLGITVVGWEFTAQRTRLAGFGASRYAALQFCKELRSPLPGNGPPPLRAAWSCAWVFDDNVAALAGLSLRREGNPVQVVDRLPVVENAVAAVAYNGAGADPRPVCAGFQAGTNTEADTVLQAQAAAALGREEAAGADLRPVTEDPPGLVQQAVLWNVDRLLADRLNISPAFIAAAEDVSIVNYFKLKRLPYWQYRGISVKKATPLEDPDFGITATRPDVGPAAAYSNSRGAALVRKYRAETARLCARLESAPQASHPIPPVLIEHERLRPFIGRMIQQHRADKKLDVDRAACQAVEQMMAGALTMTYQAIADTVLDRVWKMTSTVECVSAQGAS
ncbi:hypothetical protein [Streptomyces tsukubensis]|uniref:hypothetical protein n=1 Tax=Streptomyces tsukubensis TaxID=83656 RepID=UPI00344F2978